MYKSSNGRFHLNSLTLALFVSLVFVEVFKREYGKSNSHKEKTTKLVWPYDSTTVQYSGKIKPSIRPRGQQKRRGFR